MTLLYIVIHKYMYNCVYYVLQHPHRSYTPHHRACPSTLYGNTHHSLLAHYMMYTLWSRSYCRFSSVSQGLHCSCPHLSLQPFKTWWAFSLTIPPVSVFGISSNISSWIFHHSLACFPKQIAQGSEIIALSLCNPKFIKVWAWNSSGHHVVSGYANTVKRTWVPQRAMMGYVFNEIFNPCLIVFTHQSKL